MISVILNAYKRIDFLDYQINKIQEQTVKPSEIMVWVNNEQSINLKKNQMLFIVIAAKI